MSRKSWIAYAIIGLWLLGLALALWWFQARYVRSFNEQAVIFSGNELTLPQAIAGDGPIRLVHFWDPACPCNAGNQQHLASLLEQYNGQIGFYAVQKPGTEGALPKTLSALIPLSDFPGSQSIPSTPAVGIWDKHGKLAYFGPYSAGITCNAGNSLIDPVLEALSQDRAVSVDNSLAVGCFCQWQK